MIQGEVQCDQGAEGMPDNINRPCEAQLVRCRHCRTLDFDRIGFGQRLLLFGVSPLSVCRRTTRNSLESIAACGELAAPVAPASMTSALP